MSADQSWLALRLEGPLQSWGFDSQYNRRGTGLMPTKSGIAGMCCAAIGYERGSKEEKRFLESFSSMKMTVISGIRSSKGRVVRLEDYHTVKDTMKASGGLKQSHITHRQYLTDASFGVLLSGDSWLIGEIEKALKDPRWGIWLGRKTCIPSAPVLAGVFKDQDSALVELTGGRPLEEFTRQEEAVVFAEGRDSLPDQAISFSSSHRKFSLRRVITTPGKK